MSYSIWLEIDTGAPEPAVIWESNYTSNCSGMWWEALGRSLRDFQGAPCSESAGPLAEGAQRMQAEPERYRAMNPENGWGDYEGALEFLRDLAEACKTHSRAVIGMWS